MANQVYEIVTNQILEELDKGTIPWQRPWKSAAAHRNTKTGFPYRGINTWLLEIAQWQGDYAYPLWLSFKQCQALGGNVRKGEKSTLVVFWKIHKREEKQSDGSTKEKTLPLLRYYRVFNIDQCEGLEKSKLVQRRIDEVSAVANTGDPVEAAQSLIDEMQNPPTIRHGGDRACYVPVMDSVTLPEFRSFLSPANYYSTALHELAHSTGHDSRVGRDLNGSFGTDPYAKEELIAEMAAAMCMGTVGLFDETRETTAGYIDHWRRRISEDPKLIVTAAAAAQKAADYIIGAEAKAESSDSASPAERVAVAA